MTPPAHTLRRFRVRSVKSIKSALTQILRQWQPLLQANGAVIDTEGTLSADLIRLIRLIRHVLRDVHTGEEA